MPAWRRSAARGDPLIYTANCAAMNGLMAYLTENCCGGDTSDCAVGTAVCDPGDRCRESVDFK